METKPTYEELEQRVKEFEKELFGFKRIEMELRESEDRLKSYYHATFEGIAISEQGKIIEVNHQLADMFGYERAELIGKEIIDLVAEEDREVVLRNIRSDFDQPYESKVLHKDGSILYIEVHGQQIQHQGRLARVTAIHDLSERKQAEEVLRESKQQLKHLFENANEGVFLLNLDGHFIRVNNRTVEIFGYSKEEFAGMTVHDVSHPEDLDISPEILQRFKSGEIENLIFEKRYIHKKGHMFYGQVSTSIVRDPEGNSLYFVSHLMDITERKQTEEALRKAHDNLEQRVKERTKELEIQKGGLKELNTAMKVLLKKREEDKMDIEDNVMANIKELINPYFEKMNKTELDEQQKAYLSILKSNLNEITSPFTRKMSLKHLYLTPTEIRIANLIRHGRPTKKIAKLLNASPRTIETHRKNIRGKIGLRQKRSNLRSYLMSLH